MIKTIYVKTESKGTTSELLADLSCIVDALYYGILIKEMSEEEAEKLIRESVEIGLKDNEDIKRESVEELKKATTELLEAMLNVLKGKGEE